MAFTSVLRRLIVVLVLATAGVGGLALGAASAPSPDTDSDGTAGPHAVAVDVVDEVLAPSATTSTTDAPPSTTIPAPVEPEQGDPEPEAPAPAHLTVSDGTIGLPVNTFSGSFDLINDGGQPTAWTWVGDHRVTVSLSQGILDAGEAITIDFEVDSAQLQWGENLLANCITYDEGAVDVWITATPFKLLVPVDISA